MIPKFLNIDQIVQKVYDSVSNAIRVKLSDSEIQVNVNEAPTVAHAGFVGDGKFGQLLIQNGGEIRSARIVRE